MAKVRVYQLAKELETDSKDLVEKLKAGGMNIKNYMSTLDEDAVLKARDIFTGVVSEVIEERRIKSNVIRRRKKTVKMEPELQEAQPEDAAETLEVEPDELAPESPQIEAVQERLEDEKSVPEEIEKEPMAAEPVPEVSLEKHEKTGEEREEDPKEREIETPGKSKIGAKAKEKPKKGKKKKIEQPAKIIKRPEEGPLKAVIKKKEEKPGKKAEAKKPVDLKPLIDKMSAPPSEEKDEKSSKKRKDKKRSQKTEITRKKSFRTRKLSVIERADLYDGRKPKRKKKDSALTKESRKKIMHTEITVPKAIKRRIKVQETVTVAELGKAMGVKAVELIKKLIAMGVMANLNKTIDFETASLVADEFGYELELDQLVEESLIEEPEDKPEDLKPRPPVVTIMGHVDHGKTSLLDYIRQSNIIAGESGGITQHIGAYYVERQGGDIVFLDTPGHEAFTAMRARGAKVTDIIVLVVAADDGVMPQTKEAINHARAANIPIVVAVNKIDKAEANIDRVKRELAELELVPEEWGGDTIYGNISAKTGDGINELLELILLQSEILELKANPEKSARGTIIEARLDKSKGSVATVLIKGGTLHQGDFFVCGGYYGKVRAMVNNRGRRIKEAKPAVPLELYGISGVPMAGDEFIVVNDEKKAKQIISHRAAKTRTKDVTRRGIVNLEDLFQKIKEGEVKELNIVIKADVQGSLEALSDSLLKLSTEEVKLKLIHASTGAITETDVMLASASGAIIIGFNVRANPRVTEVAEKEKVDIRYYDVIYNVTQDIRMAMSGLLEPIQKENVIGRADIKEVFHVPKVGSVAGCYVTDGHVERNAHIRLLRDEVVVYDGKLSSLRRFKDDVKEVQTGYECGIGLENYQDIKPGDVFEVYQIEEVAAEL